MEEIVQGNALADGGPYRGWFLGDFVSEAARRHSAVEIKWGVHPPGQAREAYARDQAHSLSVLIRGRFRLIFRREGMERHEVLLINEGDYVLWPPGVEHGWIAEGEVESVILTVRWPSRNTALAGCDSKTRTV